MKKKAAFQRFLRSAMYLFDTHCHLQDERLLPCIEDVMRRANGAGVKKFLCCGSCETDWQSVLNLCKRFAGCIPAFGVHPWYVSGCSDTWVERLTQLLAEIPGAAVGEIGLDHAVNNRNDVVQMNFFYRQLVLAHTYKRPVSIHCRKAWGALLEVLRREPALRPGMVIHSYSGPVELIPELQNYGIRISFSGSVTFGQNKRVRTAAKTVAPSHLLVETDSPDIPPALWGTVNEPSALVYVARELAMLREVSPEEIAVTTTTVAENLYGDLSMAGV